MNLAKEIYQKSLSLPEHLARETLDFIEFLEQRHGIKPARVTTPATEEERKAALAHLASLRINFGGKPIPDRDALYDEARGG